MREVRLEEITTVSSGQGAPQGDSSYSFDEGIPFIKAGDMDFLTNGGSIENIQKVERDVAEENKLTEYPKGSIVFAKSGMSAKKDRIYCLGADSYVVNHLAIIEPNDKEFLSKFLTYYLWFYKPSKLIRDEAYPSIRISDIRKLEIPLPSLSEQKAIVAKLDRAQRLIDIDRQMLAKYDELIQSVFLEMFGDPVTNPKGWESLKLSKVCYKITDGTHHSPNTFEIEEFPYITAKHVDPFKVDFFSNPSYVKKEDHKKIYSRCNPEKGDVLLIKDGATTGKAAINPYNFEFSMLSSLALLKLNNSKLKGNYLINVLNDERYKDLIRQKYMSGVAIKRYTLKKINQFEIPVPDIELQKQYDKIVLKINFEKQATGSSLKKSEKLFSSLVQEAFSNDL